MKKIFVITCTLLVTLGFSGSAWARDWDNGGNPDNTWHNALNWGGDVLPGDAENANVSNGYTATYTAATGSEIISGLNVGTTGGGTSTLTLSGGTLENETGAFFIGRFGGNTGILNITGGTLIDDNFSHNFI